MKVKVEKKYNKVTMQDVTKIFLADDKGNKEYFAETTGNALALIAEAEGFIKDNKL